LIAAPVGKLLEDSPADVALEDDPRDAVATDRVRGTRPPFAEVGREAPECGFLSPRDGSRTFDRRKTSVLIMAHREPLFLAAALRARGVDDLDAAAATGSAA